MLYLCILYKNKISHHTLCHLALFSLVVILHLKALHAHTGVTGGATLGAAVVAKVNMVKRIKGAHCPALTGETKLESVSCQYASSAETRSQQPK